MPAGESDLLGQIREAENTGYPLASDSFKAELAARLDAKQSRGGPAGVPEIGL